ncbi:MAG: virulence-associated protein E [Rhodospirillaceae bacterium]|nr:virulence-associated protein E [Rhodospirillaceae bacterium]|tara:strand:+ start:555 stop:1442 length:888 start_codon:yes stop_codon:yes gene_type:complete
MMSAAEIAQALGGANPVGNGWMACCPAHDDRTPSLKIIDTEDGGVAVHCFGGCEWQMVLDALKARGLMSGDASKVDHKEIERRRADRARKNAEDIKCRINRAKKIWAESVPVTGTIGETYLHSRRLSGPWPATLRFNASLFYQPGLILPGLVAPVTRWPDRHLCGVHRTYLRLDGTGKAGVASPRKALGVLHAAAIRLAPASEHLVVGEGIESVLSAMEATGLPGWAAVSAGGLERLALPDGVRQVTIAADNDPTGIKAAEHAAAEWTSQGRCVRVAIPPMPGADFNDVLSQRSA